MSYFPGRLSQFIQPGRSFLMRYLYFTATCQDLSGGEREREVPSGLPDCLLTRGSATLLTVRPSPGRGLSE